MQNKSIFIEKCTLSFGYSEVQMMFKIQKGYDTESKTFRLPVGMIRKLEEVAAKNNTSLNRVVIQCLNYALENLDESDHDAPKE